MAALHGVTGAWDELILLVAGIVIAVAVVHLTRRESRKSPEESSPDHESAAPGDRGESG